VLQSNPFVEKYWQESVWTDFIGKYQLMVKEKVMMALRNPARKRRYTKRFFNDLQILITEGNFTDEKLLTKNNIKINQTNTTGLSLSIGMTLE